MLLQSKENKIQLEDLKNNSNTLSLLNGNGLWAGVLNNLCLLINFRSIILAYLT